ncbi:hypothetical protein [Borrelia turcica]|nr:hypothetical protein [Borrelia turcica]
MKIYNINIEKTQEMTKGLIRLSSKTIYKKRQSNLASSQTGTFCI